MLPGSVVGVVADAKVWTLGEAPRNMVYVPLLAALLAVADRPGEDDDGTRNGRRSRS